MRLKEADYDELNTYRAYNIKLALRDFWNQDPRSAEGYRKR